MFSYPAEWTPHKSVWLAWPSAKDLWEEDLPAVQQEFTELCLAISLRGEQVCLLVSDDEAETEAKKALSQAGVKFFRIPYGDIWLRDTAPLFLKSQTGEFQAARFQFNGWGEKYILPHDPLVSARISESLKEIKSVAHSWVLEGGSIEVDEWGTCLTTEQCLLNKNRNPKLERDEIEERLKSALGLKKILWLKDGLINDHTDGHIDTIARFAPGGKVICMKAQSASDPNAKILEAIAKDLRQMTNAVGKSLEVIQIPSPGEIFDDEGILMPASYVNFYISNGVVIVPTYGSPYDSEAVRQIGACFSDRKTIGLPAKNILKGGGAFHCITQQLPE